MEPFHCYEIEFEHVDAEGDPFYGTSVVMAENVEAAAVFAHRICGIDNDISIWYHQPVMLNADGSNVIGTHAGGAKIGPVYEAHVLPGVFVDIDTIRERVTNNERLFRPSLTWEPHIV